MIISGTSMVLSMNPFRYRGYYFDSETGLYYLQSRYYDPKTGRFISPDAYSYLEPDTVNGLNLYSYCGNNPVMNVDPTGCFFLACLIVGMFAGAVVIGTASGVAAARSGASGLEIFGQAMLGAAEGALVGGFIGAGIGLIGLGAGAIFSGGAMAIAGGGMAGLGVAAVGGGAIVVGGAIVAEGIRGLNIVLSRIGNSGGYRIDHHYPNDHDPIHVHISGDDGMTRVDLNGNPIQGSRPMTHGERKAFRKLFSKIINALTPWL